MPQIGAIFIPSYLPTLIEFLCAAASLCFCHFSRWSSDRVTLAVLWSSYPPLASHTGLTGFHSLWLSSCTLSAFPSPDIRKMMPVK